jgi:hypothetical protein
MGLTLAAGAPAMWTEFWDLVWLVRTRVEEMATGLEPIHYALIALSALIIWGLMGRRH